MKSQGKAIAAVLVGIAAGNAALAGFFLARGDTGAAMIFAVMIPVVVLLGLTGAFNARPADGSDGSCAKQ